MKGASHTKELTEKNESSGEGGNGGGVARLLHDPEDNGDGEGTQQRGERAHANVGNLMD